MRTSIDSSLTLIQRDFYVLKDAYYKYPTEKQEINKVYLAGIRIIGLVVAITGMIQLKNSILNLGTTSTIFSIVWSVGQVALGLDIFIMTRNITDKIDPVIKEKTGNLLKDAGLTLAGKVKYTRIFDEMVDKFSKNMMTGKQIAEKLSAGTFLKPFWIATNYFWVSRTMNIFSDKKEPEEAEEEVEQLGAPNAIPAGGNPVQNAPTLVGQVIKTAKAAVDLMQPKTPATATQQAPKPGIKVEFGTQTPRGSLSRLLNKPKPEVTPAKPPISTPIKASGHGEVQKLPNSV